MGLFGNKNNCPFKDQCIFGSDECSYSRSGDFTSCEQYESWSAGGDDDSDCPYKDRCPDYPHLCLFAGHCEECFKYTMFEEKESRRNNIAKRYEEDKDENDYEEDNDDDDEEDNDDEDDNEERDNKEVNNSKEINIDNQQGENGSADVLHEMPQMSVFNNKQAFCFSNNHLFLLIRKNKSDKWKFAGKVKHHLQHPVGTLIPIRYSLYIWGGQQCYVLGIYRTLSVDFSFYSNRTFISTDENDIERWQWYEMDRDKFINMYLCATGRDPLNTRVTDRETRARNVEDAVRELNSGSWKSHLSMSEMWTLEKENRKRRTKKTSVSNDKPKTKNVSREYLEKEKKTADLSRARNGNVDTGCTKSHVVAGILAILLGSFGAHKFYMGKKTTGILYLLFCWTFIPLIIGVLEGVKYLTEGQENFSERIDD